MSKEIERKFLVNGTDWRNLSRRILIHQGYLNRQKERIVRVRTMNNKGFLTIKSITKGIVRQEFEYEIPLEDAEYLLTNMCEQPLLIKHRYLIDHAGLTWEVDEFHGANEGLVIAEVELSHKDQSFEKPAWVGQEITDNPRYYNSNLVGYPYSDWPAEHL